MIWRECDSDVAMELRTGEFRGDSGCRSALCYVLATTSAYGRSARTGRTSTLPSRIGGIFDAIWMASLRSVASIR